MSIEVKTGILWEPERLTNNQYCFALLTITKKDGVPSFRQDPMTVKALDKIHSQWSPSTYEVLKSLSVEENKKVESAFIKQQQKAGSNNQATSFIIAAVEKLRFEQLQTFLSKSEALALYHRVPNPNTGNPMTATCKWNKETPTLSFGVSKPQGHLHLDVYVTLEDKKISFGDFKRFGFMLQKQNEYWMLELKDSRTLDWLIRNKPAQYASQPDLFLEKIITKLEENYTVDRNNLFEVNLIDQKPECSVLFTELSGSFLMLTPRWSYDGFIVEGAYQAEQRKMEKGKQYIIQRDEETELNFISFVQSLHPNFPAQAARGFYFLSFSDAKKKQWFIKTFRELLNQNVAVTGLDMLQHFRYSPYEAETTLEVKNQTATSLELNAKVLFGKEEVPLLNIQKMLLNDQRNILLKDDSIGFFSDEWVKKYATIFKHAVIYKNRMTLPPWFFLGRANDSEDSLEQEIIPTEWQNRWFAWQKDEHVVDKPILISTELRPYQQKGFEWMVLLSQIQAGACLADDMGLGKTLQTICFLAYQQQLNPKKKSIVICPASLIYNWEQEIKKFAPTLLPFIYRAQERKHWEEFTKNEEKVLIVSYHTLRQDIEILSTFPWQVAVIDESQNIKNPTARVTKAVYAIEAHNKIALSGTPVMNNTFDLYAQLQFVLPGLLGSREFFRKEYANPIDREAKPEKVDALRQLTNPFILRRTKKQVATDLPDKTESILWCEMGEEQKSFYEEVKSDIKDSLFLDIQSEGLQKNKLSILQGIQKLRQICDAPVLMKQSLDYTPCNESIKLDRIVEALQNHQENGHKALVFSQFTSMLDLIAAKCESLGIVFYHFDGGTAVEKRQEMVSAFQQEEDEATAFLISLKSGNAGLNLTQAQYVYLVDPWWNRAVEQQAIDRSHRIGQQSNVFAYRMICKGSIEEKIIALQEKKKFLSDELVTAEDGFVKNMTEEDLQYLFS
ncbi:MAG: ATP-dependent helicase [Pseudopedobacter saltans]|uniref:ATP-dependent helicase n=1 Tax=Pseudopedobacter saltans TaxID=151895 RepID=A0A2W5GGB3_9SPHI|nr:MAG: ATP-dependent helicase [Pseudopedobacter saltans]